MAKKEKVFVYEIARILFMIFMGIYDKYCKRYFKIIWGLLKYHKSVFIPNTPKKLCFFLLILQGKEIRILLNTHNFI